LLTSLFCFTFAMPPRFSFKQFILPFFSLINISHETLSPRLDNGLAITPPMG
jgi:alpha-galactosidase